MTGFEREAKEFKRHCQECKLSLKTIAEAFEGYEPGPTVPQKNVDK